MRLSGRGLEFPLFWSASGGARYEGMQGFWFLHIGTCGQDDGCGIQGLESSLRLIINGWYSAFTAMSGRSSAILLEGAGDLVSWLQVGL